MKNANKEKNLEGGGLFLVLSKLNISHIIHIKIIYLKVYNNT